MLSDGAANVAHTTGEGLHTLYVFPTLEVRRAGYDTSFGGGTDADYELTAETEVAYLLANGVRLARVVHEPDAMPGVSAFGGDQRVFFELGDHLGSTSVVLDKATSELVERGTYQAYGGAESDYRPSRWDSFREDYRFTGKEEDVEVGLTYFGKRFYSAQLGRWMSADPLGIDAALETDLNLYAYVRGMALKAVDPLGLCDDLNACIEGDFRTSKDPQVAALGDARPPSEAGHSLPSLPSVEGTIPRVPQGPMGRARDQLWSQVAESENAVEAFAGTTTAIFMTGAATLEEVPRMVLNLPSNGELAGQHWARASMQSDFAEAALDALTGVSYATEAAGTAVTLSIPGAYSVATPYGRAYQSLAPSALMARSEVGGGLTLWRSGTTGVSTPKGAAQFWAMEHPSTPGFGERYGIPPKNLASANFVDSATVKPDATFATRPAPPYGPNWGGAIEVVVSPGGVH